MTQDNKLIVKFNGGLLAILCEKCSVIIKTGKNFTEEEIDYAKGKLDKVLPTQFCEKCKELENEN